MSVTKQQVKKHTGEGDWLHAVCNNSKFDVKISKDGKVILVSRLSAIPIDDLTRHMEAYSKTLTVQ